MGTRSYDRLAPIYDGLAWVYGAGAIHRAKVVHVDHLQPGERALYVGAGTGAECALAAARGVSVTLVESSAAMLERAQFRFRRLGLSGRLEYGDALARRKGRFDAVVVPFFLNTLEREGVGQALVHLGAQLRPGGRFISVDFRGPKSGIFSAVQKLHYLPPLLLFALLTGNPLHELYDYVALARRFVPHFRLKESVSTRAFGLPLYETLIWEVT